MKHFIVLLSFIFLLGYSNAQSNWTIQNSGTNKFLTDVHFADSQNAWVSGWTGTILHTADGGTSWVMQDAPPNNGYQTIHFVDNQTGWAAGYGGQIIATLDGGETWATQNSGTQYYINDIHFINSSIGWTAGGDYEGLTSKAKREILFTDNGGQNWTSQYYGYDERPLNSIHFPNETTGFAVGEAGTILKTNDGGNNWNQIMSDNMYHFYDVFFTDELTGWVVGQDLSLDHYAVMLKTNDGGENWDIQTFNTNESLNGIVFTDAENGWAVGGSTDVGRVLKSEDGGITWTDVSPSDAKFLMQVSFADLNNGLAVGFNGTIISMINNSTLGVESSTSKKSSKISIYPNPSKGVSILNYETEINDFVTIKLFDINGREIETILQRKMREGIQEQQIETRHLIKGNYLVSIQTNTSTKVLKLSVL